MVTRKQKPQVDYNAPNLGSATKQALNVPFIPATRRSGVGDNAINMGSALQRLGGALGTLQTSVKASEERDKADLHAGRLRHEEAMNSASQDPPEVRAEVAAQQGEHPVTGGLKQISEVRNEVVPKLKQSIQQQMMIWQANGWQHVTADEDGQEIKEKVTDEFIQKYFKELLTTQAYDVYYEKGEDEKWTIDPRSNAGRLRQPQIRSIKSAVDGARDDALKDLRKYRYQEMWKDGYEITRTNAQNFMLEGHAKGLTGEALLHHFQNAASNTHTSVVGLKVVSKETRNEIFKTALHGLDDKLDNPGSARAFISMLDGRLMGPDGKTGAMLRDTYPEVVAPMQKKAQKILNKVIDRELKIEAQNKSYTSIVRNNGRHEFKDIEYIHSNGDKFKYTAKEQQDDLVALIKSEANLAADPRYPERNRRQVLKTLAGTGLKDPAIIDFFDSVNFGIDASNETDFSQVMTTYRDLELLAPTTLKEYIADPATRAKLANLDRIMKTRPGPPTGGDPEAEKRRWQEMLVELNASTGSDGNPPKFSDKSEDYNKYWKSYLNSSDFKKLHYDDDEREDLELSLRMRLTDGNEIRRLTGYSKNAKLSKSQFDTMISEERARLDAQRVMVEGVPIRTPPNSIGLDAQNYATVVEAHRDQVARQAGLHQSKVALEELRHGGGYRYVNKDTRLPIRLKGKSGEFDAVFPHKDIIGWGSIETNGAIDAKATRAGGIAALKRTIGLAEKRIIESRKQINENTSWLDQIFKGRESKRPDR